MNPFKTSAGRTTSAATLWALTDQYYKPSLAPTTQQYTAAAKRGQKKRKPSDAVTLQTMAAAVVAVWPFILPHTLLQRQTFTRSLEHTSRNASCQMGADIFMLGGLDIRTEKKFPSPPPGPDVL